MMKVHLYFYPGNVNTINQETEGPADKISRIVLIENNKKIIN